MKYRLKDRALQSHLDAISGGEFTATLESGSFEFDEDGFAVVTVYQKAPNLPHAF